MEVWGASQMGACFFGRVPLLGLLRQPLEPRDLSSDIARLRRFAFQSPLRCSLHETKMGGVLWGHFLRYGCVLNGDPFRCFPIFRDPTTL